MNDSFGRRLYVALFVTALCVAIGALIVTVLKPFFSAIGWAVVLAVAFEGPRSWLDGRLAGRRGLAAGIATFVVALLVVLPAIVLGAAIYDQASSTVVRVSDELKARDITSINDFVEHPTIRRVLHVAEERLGLTAKEMLERVKAAASQISSFVARESRDAVFGFFDAVLTFLMTLFILFFLFRDGPELAAGISALIPLPAAERASLVERLRRLLETIFRGSLLCAIVQGLTGGIGWAIVGLPSPLLAGVMMAILSLLPVGGTAIVWLPGAIFLWVTGHHGAALFLAIWGVVVTSTLIDNVLKPLLIGGGSEMNTLIVMLGVFGGIAAFGFLGVFVGPIALAVFSSILGVLRALANPAEPPPGETALV